MLVQAKQVKVWLSFGWLMTEKHIICYLASVSHESQGAVGQVTLLTLMRHTQK